MYFKRIATVQTFNFIIGYNEQIVFFSLSKKIHKDLNLNENIDYNI